MAWHRGSKFPPKIFISLVFVFLNENKIVGDYGLILEFKITVINSDFKNQPW